MAGAGTAFGGRRDRPPAELRVENLELGYGPAAVLKGVNLTARPGDFVGLIGPNSCGKSTLLKAISRVLRPRAGRVLIDGRDVWQDLDPRETARTVAVVPQDFPADLPFTVSETVLIGRTPYVGRLRGEQPVDLARAREAMRATGTLGLGDRVFSELAGGERQRVVLAKALAQEPRLLLLDEPTSHLDLGHQVEILDLLLSLSRAEGLTVLTVLHDLNLAAMYCDCLYLLGNGAVQAEGPPGDVLTTANLERVYGSRVLVGRHAVYGCPQVTLLSGRLGPDRVAARRPEESRAGSRETFAVHVVAGGGKATGLLESLTAAGYRVSAGPVNAGDNDWQTGRALGLDLITIPPFSPVERDALARAAAAMRRASAVVVSEVPFGHGNVTILEAVLEAARGGTPVGLVMGGQPTLAARDFTGGRATALGVELAREGAVSLAHDADVLTWIGELAGSQRTGG